MVPQPAVKGIICTCGYKNVTASLKSADCRECGVALPEKDTAKLGLKFRTYDRSTGRVALPIADATAAASNPEEKEPQAKVGQPGQAYLDGASE